MKQLENSGLFVDLSSEEMANLNGGSVIVEKILYWGGYILGALARAQEINGDSGQWMQ